MVGRAFVNVNASQTDSVVVAASGQKKILVHGWIQVAGGTATTLVFNTKGTGSGTAISPIFANGANGGSVVPYMPNGWCQTSAGHSLTVTTGAGSATGLIVIYSYVD